MPSQIPRKIPGERPAGWWSVLAPAWADGPKTHDFTLW